MEIQPQPMEPRPSDPGVADTQTLVEMGVVEPPPVPRTDPPPPPDRNPM